MQSTNRGKPQRRRRAAMIAGTVVAAASLLLTGCSASSQPAASSTATSEKNVTLTFLNQSRGQEAALTYLAKEYTKKTGVKISIDSPGPADYVPKLQALAQSKQMPDIYSAFDPTTMAPFYKAGWAMDLTSELKKDGWSKDFSPQVIKLSTFEKGNNLGVKPGIYTVHWETQAYGLLADPKDSGISATDLPKTTDQLIDQLAASNKAGKGGFSIAASETPRFVQYVASNYLTDKQISDTFAGTYKWTSSGWKKAFQLLADLRDAGAIQNNALPGGQNDNPTEETNFFTKHSVASIFDASPGVAVAHATSPDYTSFISIPLPKAPGAKYTPRTPGVTGKGAVINPRGKHVQAALDFVKWLTAAPQQKVFADQAYIIPTNPQLLASGKLAAPLQGFASSIKNMQVLPNNPTAQVTDAITRDSQQLVLGKMTVDQVVADVQTAQDSSQ
ncbi:ABC transporter substrate-binding protein [Rathayibacter sp. CAU 1779]